MRSNNSAPQFLPDYRTRNLLQPVLPRVVSFVRNFTGPQFKVYSSSSRFTVVAAGRRWGKTSTGLHKMVCYAASSPRQLCYFVAPTARQAAEIAWRALLENTPRELVRYERRSTLELELINGSTIKLHGPESLRGVGLDFVMLDEFAYMPPTLWGEVIRPMLADRQGRALISSTPAGFNHFYDLFVEAKSKPDWAVFHFATQDGSLVPERELELLRSTMDSKLYAQEIEARFEPQEGRIFHAFSREVNVREVTLIGELTILVGMDFNVNPMVSVVAQKIGDECHVGDEVVLKNSNTLEMMEELSRRYPQRGLVHPDPTGAARKTSAEFGVTDHDIIGRAGWQVHSSKPYPIINRINAINALLRNANGRARLLIHPKCKNLIRSLEGLTYKEGTRVPDKSSALDHAADALGYLVGAVFPTYSRTVSITNAFTGADLMA